MGNNKITAIVLAAGQGKRMRSPVAKQFLTLRDKPVLYYSLKAFEESGVDEIILVTGRGQIDYCRENIVDHYGIRKVSRIIEGGKERYDSVNCALEKIDRSDYVLIHDGARPFITKELIETVIEQVSIYKACIIGTRVRDTIKIVDDSDFITATPDRSDLWAAQTPQAFEFEAIRNAYQMLFSDMEDTFDPDRSRRSITDDAMVYETYLKKPVKIIEGEYCNLKITVPEDLVMAEAILNRLLY